MNARASYECFPSLGAASVANDDWDGGAISWGISASDNDVGK